METTQLLKRIAVALETNNQTFNQLLQETKNVNDESLQLLKSMCSHMGIIDEQPKQSPKPKRKRK